MPEFFDTILTQGRLSLENYLLCIFTAFLCGVIAALTSAIKGQSNKSFSTALMLLPAIVATVIIMVNGNIGTGIAVAGAFSLVRFRSVPGRARDITLIFLAMTVGIISAAGYIVIAVMFTILVSVVVFIMGLLPSKEDRLLEMKLTVPESLNFADEFEDLFKKYTKYTKLVSVRTSNMGSLYKLHYQIELKNRAEMKAFIDEVRCRNGNLEIMITENVSDPDDLL